LNFRKGGLEAQIDAIINQGGKLESPWIKSDIEVDIDLYKRAIFKIAYESAWYFIGDDFLNTEFSNHARSYIMNGIDFPYSGDIKIEASEFGKTFGLDEVCHFVMHWCGGGVEVMAVGIFDIFSAAIEIGHCPNDARGFRILVNNVVTGSVSDLKEIDIVRMMLGKKRD